MIIIKKIIYVDSYINKENTNRKMSMDENLALPDLEHNTELSDSTKSNAIIDTNDNNLQILYITFAIIVGLLLIWIVIVAVTKEDPLKILSAMNNVSAQMQPVSD